MKIKLARKIEKKKKVRRGRKPLRDHTLTCIRLPDDEWSVFKSHCKRRGLAANEVFRGIFVNFSGGKSKLDISKHLFRNSPTEKKHQLKMINVTIKLPSQLLREFQEMCQTSGFGPSAIFRLLVRDVISGGWTSNLKKQLFGSVGMKK